ncbi:MAG: dihydropteroate synthase [Anaerolineales bacterium]|nr:dihydropteroate synthase [Anaerolineales bacterium]
MKTTLLGKTTEVTIDNEGPFVIIGEKINPTGNKKLRQALLDQDFDTVRIMAEEQIDAGADILDVNVGLPEIDDVATLPEVAGLLGEEFDVPICIDSPNPAALAAALEVVPGKPLVNSVSGEEAALKAVLPLVKDRNAAVIGLTIDEGGIPSDVDGRTLIAERILERAVKIGIPEEDVILDPLVLAISTDHNAGVIAFRTIEELKQRLGVNINLGASNISFGLPDRHVINQAFLALAMAAGASCAITDPSRLGLTVRATDLLLGRDAFSARYIAHYRARKSQSGP